MTPPPCCRPTTVASNTKTTSMTSRSPHSGVPRGSTGSARARDVLSALGFPLIRVSQPGPATQPRLYPCDYEAMDEAELLDELHRAQKSIPEENLETWSRFS